jgi:hypothetical protein
MQTGSAVEQICMEYELCYFLNYFIGKYTFCAHNGISFPIFFNLKENVVSVDSYFML